MRAFQSGSGTPESIPAAGSAAISSIRHPAGHLTKGRAAEDRARRFLERQGLVCIETNYRCQPGEIDLIMRDNDALVFVEVRYRRDRRYGGALESIDHRKQRRLRAAAEHYLQRRHRGRTPSCRFDVVLITGSSAAGEEDVDWIANAL